MSVQTGKPYTVGHIIPLQHPYVSGLHVPSNLQVEPAAVNFSKGNRWNPDQIDLFPNTTEVEQYELPMQMHEQDQQPEWYAQKA